MPGPLEVTATATEYCGPKSTSVAAVFWSSILNLFSYLVGMGRVRDVLV